MARPVREHAEAGPITLPPDPVRKSRVRWNACASGLHAYAAVEWKTNAEKAVLTQEENPKMSTCEDAERLWFRLHRAQ
jgi:hypothetical protein